MPVRESVLLIVAVASFAKSAPRTHATMVENRVLALLQLNRNVTLYNALTYMTTKYITKKRVVVKFWFYRKVNVKPLA